MIIVALGAVCHSFNLKRLRTFLLSFVTTARRSDCPNRSVSLHTEAKDPNGSHTEAKDPNGSLRVHGSASIEGLQECVGGRLDGQCRPKELR
jgi:hypothetical protein